MIVCMCGFRKVWVCVGVGFVKCECMYVCGFCNVCVCMCGLRNVWVCVCVGFLMCGCV